MRAVISREIRNYFKNPVYYVGILIITCMMLMSLWPYLQLRYFEADAEILEVDASHVSDADVMDGYIPASYEKQIEKGLHNAAQELTKYMGLSMEDAQSIVANAWAQTGSIEDFSEIMETEYSIYGAASSFVHASHQAGTPDEVNAYIEKALESHTYTWYFARKFADFAGLFLVFFAAILMAFLFYQDTRKSIYELLHTKPVSATSYVLGKIIGGLLALLAALLFVTIIFTTLALLHGRREGFPVSALDLIRAAVTFAVPGLIMVICIYTMAALLFKNPLPAVPIIVIYIIYSNMGTMGDDGLYDFYGRPLTILTRFSGKLLDSALTTYAISNQFYLLGTSIAIATISIWLWKRRRVF